MKATLLASGLGFPEGPVVMGDGRVVLYDGNTGAVLAEIHLGEHATNCVFDGPGLYATAIRGADIEASQRTGTFWRVETGTTGLELIPAQL